MVPVGREKEQFENSPSPLHSEIQPDPTSRGTGAWLVGSKEETPYQIWQDFTFISIQRVQGKKSQGYLCSSLDSSCGRYIKASFPKAHKGLVATLFGLNDELIYFLQKGGGERTKER